ncbi:MAG: DNA repair protein RecO [Raineya sp.]|jgi:DNA repair protein RecO (recombination protein O)|nr:DNA repair protein RecO [Raineya sp.]
MLHKTQGICIHFIKYKETSIIAKIYTKNFGLQSYLLNGVRKEKPAFKIALFQPLTQLDMVVYHKEGKDMLQRISEIRCPQPYQSLQSDGLKVNMAFFLSEVLSKTLQGEEEHQELYDFLATELYSLDASQNPENFPVYFLVHLIEKLGFLGKNASFIFEQLYQAQFIKQKPAYFEPEIQWLEKLQQTKNFESLEIPTNIRKQLLNYLLAYYRFHFEYFGEIKSLNILRSL